MIYCPMSHDINNVYAFLLTFVPTLAILAKTRNALPANMVDAANMIAYLKPPLSCEIRAPAMGVPVNVAKLMTLQIRNKIVLGIPEHHSHSDPDFTHLIRICECTDSSGR
jgi:hypothetical protein